ncbi:MAG: aminotransferase [Alphaproteobacteria bacterium CG_4_10_14_0_2_um_filter_63_37]|nr:MAG: class V aminotransferase [Proteobacteria bacterium CG1_02_64_396]PJA25356.1 MAG: aminotransferase [Alphaproteobacteria bacterium CG_4_10_14_0_2_um_filter_63_37]
MHPEFPLQDGLIHLNHAAVAPWPQRTVHAVAGFAMQNGVAGSLNYPQWLEVEARLRRRLAHLIDAPSPDDIALCKNTSEALSLIAWGLTWQPGDNVVISDQEFPSNRIVWESLTPLGVEVRRAEIGGEDPEGAIIAACDGRTRVVALSAVQYGVGLKLDLPPIGDHCRKRGILFVVDAIQQLGAAPFDVEAAQADFVAADGHKWMLGPEGIALFYSRPEARAQLQLRQFGWHMVEHVGDFERLDWQPAATARRFEPGSPNMLGIYGLEASLSLLEEVGIDVVSRRIGERIELLIGSLQAAGHRLLTPRDPARHAGIVTFVPRDGDTHGAFARLQQAGVFCAPRGGGIRFSPHFHTPFSQLDIAVNAVEK